MTLLYRLSADAETIAAHFGGCAGDDPWPGGTVSPGSFAPVLTMGREFVSGPRSHGQPLRMIPRLWGVPPPPAAGETGRGVLTVRNPDSPFWIGNLRNSEFRCLIPATAVMAWSKPDPTTGRRRQLWLAPTDQPLFALAGVWKDSELPSFAMLTCDPNAVWRDAGHSAMPVILPYEPEARHVWLRAEWNRAAGLLQPYSSSQIREISAAG